jgi:SulP family sulfate permease
VIFTGVLEAHLGFGIEMALFGSAVLGALVAAGSTYPAAIANIQSETAVFVLFGVFRLGNTIRYIPFPVIGAFLAYIAWLLLRGAMTTMTGQPPTLESGLLLLEPGMLPYWLPGALAAVALLALQLTRRHYLNAPAVLVSSVGAFWLVAWLAGAPATELRATGYRLAGLSQEQAWSPMAQVAALGQADWGLALRQLPQIAIVCLMAMITLLVSASSLEIASRSDVDLNKELKVTGIGNLVSGSAAGCPAITR